MSTFLERLMSDDTAVGTLDRLKTELKSRGGSGSNLFYNYRRHLPYDATSTVRFLPASSDLMENEVQPRFWLPKKIIRLRFENPEQAESEVILPIPVMQMYTGGKTENDLILKQVKVLYDEADKLKKNGKEEEAKQIQAKASYHWTRGECIAQGFVVKSGFIEPDLPENPIRLFELNKQLMNVITATLNSDDPETKLEFWPCHGKKGSNFVIKKTRSGDYPKYDAGSCFSRQGPTSLSTEQLASLDEHGLFDLNDFLPKRPSDAEYQVLAEIVRMSIEGERVWDKDWEAHLDTVKVYRTNMKDSGGSDVDAETLQSQVRDTMSRLNGSGSTSTTEIM
jgi:hypothetical protein